MVTALIETPCRGDASEPPLRRHWLGKALLRCSFMMALMIQGNVCLADDDLPTKFSNQGSITNTRHNMNQRQAAGGPSGVIMDTYRNDYGQVCVYCHTPHGANSTIAAPLWNRNILGTTYVTYDTLGSNTMTQTVFQPGAASLPCLSCHDGLQAVDAILNMPGSGRYMSSYTPSPSDSFLQSWTNPSGLGPFTHLALNSAECLACHSAGLVPVYKAGAADFTAAAIGTDLRDDHPIGITFPATNGTGTDWKTPNGTRIVGGRTTKFFDENSNSRLDKAEIRLYDNGNGPSVECASCHDPHGVAFGGPVFNATFLRKPASEVCLTCHSK